VVGAATEKLREPKHVRTCGTANKLQYDERDGAWYQYHSLCGIATCIQVVFDASCQWEGAILHRKLTITPAMREMGNRVLLVL